MKQKICPNTLLHCSFEQRWQVFISTAVIVCLVLALTGPGIPRQHVKMTHRKVGWGGRAACIKVPCLTPRNYKPQLLLFLLHNKKEMCSVLHFGTFITSPIHQWGLKSHFERNDSWAKTHIESWVWQVLFVENGIVELVKEDGEGWGKWKWHAWIECTVVNYTLELPLNWLCWQFKHQVLIRKERIQYIWLYSIFQTVHHHFNAILGVQCWICQVLLWSLQSLYNICTHSYVFFPIIWRTRDS